MRVSPRLATLLIVITALMALPGPLMGESEPPPLEDVFAPFQTLLDAHLSEKDLDDDGLVSAFDYQAALDSDRSMEAIAQQRKRLADFDIETLDKRERFNAFWLNAYNFFMIAHILEEQPDGELIESVWDYGGRYNPFRNNVFERELFQIGGRQYSLDEMEKGILLGEEYWDKGWADARVHFAVNCASVGCPPLRDQVYSEENVSALLAENTRRALNTHYHLKVEGNTLYLSSLFDWYEDDYEREADSVRAWIIEHGADDIEDRIQDSNRIRYIDYDWTLNKPDNFPEFE